MGPNRKGVSTGTEATGAIVRALSRSFFPTGRALGTVVTASDDYLDCRDVTRILQCACRSGVSSYKRLG